MLLLYIEGYHLYKTKLFLIFRNEKYCLNENNENDTIRNNESEISIRTLNAINKYIAQLNY